MGICTSSGVYTVKTTTNEVNVENMRLRNIKKQKLKRVQSIDRGQILLKSKLAPRVARTRSAECLPTTILQVAQDCPAGPSKETIQYLVGILAKVNFLCNEKEALPPARCD